MSSPDTATDTGPRSLVAELVRRRNRIARVQSTFATLVAAYDLVAADLRAAHGESNHTMTAPPVAQGDCAAATAN